MKNKTAVIGNPPETKGDLQIIRKEDLDTLNIHVENVRLSIQDTGEKYLILCKHIRAKQIPPTIVREVMTAQGFHKVRIAEVNKVAQCGDEVWDEFEARALSFKKVLMIARGKGDEASATGAKIENIADVGDEVRGEVESGDLSVEDKRAKVTDRMLRAAKTILHAAADLELRSKKWTISNGYELRVVKVKQAVKEAK